MIATGYCAKNTDVCKAAVNMDGFDQDTQGVWPTAKNLKFLKLAEQKEGYQKHVLNFVDTNGNI